MADGTPGIKKRAMDVLLLTLCALSIVLAGFWLAFSRPVLGSITPDSPVPRADPVTLEEHVRAVSGGFHPRGWSDTESLDAISEYIAGRMRSYGADVSFQEYSADGLAYRNVVAVFGPTDGKSLVVGAHYDAAYDTPGADDNASGVAGLLELGRMLKEIPPDVTVELVAWTLEEPPFFATPEMGSAVHARSLGEAGADVRLVVALETIGYFSDEEDSQDYPSPVMRLFYPDRGDFVAVVGITSQGGTVARVKKAMRGASDLPVHAIAAPALIPGIDFSDHRSYWEFGYDAVMVTDTAFYRNKYYHTLQDTPDRLDYVRMAKVVEGTYAVVREYSKL